MLTNYTSFAFQASTAIHSVVDVYIKAHFSSTSCNVLLKQAALVAKCQDNNSSVFHRRPGKGAREPVIVVCLPLPLPLLSARMSTLTYYQ